MGFLVLSDEMKKDIHPEGYRPVVFEDAGNGTQFIIGSAVHTTETVTVDGVSYPKFSIEISSATHPIYTGEERTLDKTGRVERFRARAARTAK